jgi:hypothetical protein
VSELPATLTAWRALLDQPLADQRPDIDEAAITDGAEYGNSGSLTLVRDLDHFPGNLYFDAGRPVLAYVENPTHHAADLTDAGLIALVGDDVEWLRSRAGKLSRLRVAADRGIAISEQMGPKVDFVELFPPTTFADYAARLYKEPGAFIR